MSGRVARAVARGKLTGLCPLCRNANRAKPMTPAERERYMRFWLERFDDEELTGIALALGIDGECAENVALKGIHQHLQRPQGPQQLLAFFPRNRKAQPDAYVLPADVIHAACDVVRPAGRRPCVLLAIVDRNVPAKVVRTARGRPIDDLHARTWVLGAQILPNH
jgi:hypothetical protein